MSSVSRLAELAILDMSAIEIFGYPNAHPADGTVAGSCCTYRQSRPARYLLITGWRNGVPGPTSPGSHSQSAVHGCTNLRMKRRSIQSFSFHAQRPETANGPQVAMACRSPVARM